MKSLSEIETISKRASRAVGFSWGVSEEIAKGIRLLELFGFPGIKDLSEYYKLINKRNYENLIHVKKTNKPKKISFCPINLGINILDQIKKIENLKKITIHQIAYPTLFLPFLSRCSDIIGKKILFTFDRNTFLFNFNVNILSNFSKKELPTVIKKAEIIFLKNKDSFKQKDWQNLYNLSKNTFVEETESLKKGAAGAGLTDND